MTETKYNYYLKFINISLVVLGFLILFWIVNQNYALTGSVTYNWQPEDIGQNNIINLDTNDSVKALLGNDNELKWYQNDDNLKFTAKLLRNFDYIDLEIALDNISQTEINFFAQGGVEKGEYREIIRNQFLDELIWPYIYDEESNMTLWQRPNDTEDSEIIREVRQYESVDAYTANEVFENLGIINLSEDFYSRLSDYEPSNNILEINHYFRGSHVLYIYLGEGEKLDLSFNKIDLNRQIDSDIMKVKIYSGSDLFYSIDVPDDGIDQALFKLGQKQRVELTDINLPEGLYHINIDASEDVLFGEIKTKQKYLNFSKKIFLADGPNYFSEQDYKYLNLQTNINNDDLVFEVPHNESVNQEIIINQNNSKFQDVYIYKEKEEYIVEDLSGVYSVGIPRGDVCITGDSFVFSGFSLLPDFSVYSTTNSIENNINNIDYILAQYQPQNTFGTVKINKSYDLDDLMIKDNKIYFNLRMPGLYSQRGKAEIKYIKIHFQGESLGYNVIKRKIQYYFDKI